MTQHMRDKSIACPNCHKMCGFTGNLDTGKITRAVMPPECPHPTKCAREHIRGIWDRQFGANMILPSEF